MKLKEYLQGKSQVDFAKKVGTHPSMISQIINGKRPCPETLALNIELETKGQVPVEESCPHVPWHVIRGRKVAGPSKKAA